MEKDKLFIWTIYEKGTDPRFPSNFVARQFEITGKKDAPLMTDQLMIAPNVDLIRDVLKKRFSLVCMHRADTDDDSIIESWI